MLDQFFRAPWNDLYEFFAKGEPPLALELLGLNTIFLMLFMARRWRKAAAMRPETALTVQGLLVLANSLIAFRDYFRIPSL